MKAILLWFRTILHEYRKRSAKRNLARRRSITLAMYPSID